MLWSFPKARKDATTQKPICQVFYDLPSSKSSRTAAFGYGTKYDFTKEATNNPPPNAYEIPTVFKKSTKKGFSFGLSRESMAVTGGMFVGDKKSPGPGAYDVREKNKTVLAFSFRPRPNIDPLTSPKFVPGPGTYPVLETISPKGKYYLSKFKGSGATLISPAHSRRFTELKPGYPGPGTYAPTAATTEDGSYFVSKFKSSLCRTFGHSMRRNASMSSFDETPGPGFYRIPSEFGYYESNKTKKTDKNNNKTTVN
jgi:hypothetical protein